MRSEALPSPPGIRLLIEYDREPDIAAGGRVLVALLTRPLTPPAATDPDRKAAK